MPLRRPLVAVLAALAWPGGGVAEGAAAPPPPPPVARDITTEGVTLVAPAPARGGRDAFGAPFTARGGKAAFGTPLTTPGGKGASGVAPFAARGGRSVARAPGRGAISFSLRTEHGSWRKVEVVRAGSRWMPRTLLARVGGLRPATAYRFRLVVGGRAGAEATFATLPAPPPDPRPDRAAPPPPPEPPPPEPEPPAAAPDPEPEPPRPPVPAGGYLNPLAPFEFPDPSVIRDEDGTYWAYGTLARFQILRSPDLVTWTRAGSALAAKPAWAVAGEEWHPWAPSVIRRTDGTYVLFYVALSEAFGPVTNCIGVATSDEPQGPFTDHGPLADEHGALVGCGDGRGYGNIDPAPFVDADGTPYLYVSTDWSCDTSPCALRPELSVIPLSDDLRQAAGERMPLFRGLPDTWEQAPWAPVVENPWVIERDGVYHLLYSGGAWTGDYGMGHATATSPAGPFTRTKRVLSPTTAAGGAGGGMVVSGPKGGDWLVYHARSAARNAPRTLRIDPLTWPEEEGAAPEVAGPTSSVQAEGP
jgi:hypothetical protein